LGYQNRLAGVPFKDVVGNVLKSIGYTYDSNNQRIGKAIDGVVVERYVIDRDQIGLVFDRQGNQTHRYLYGVGVDQVLADETPNGTTWALADHQGTVKDLLDGNGAIISHITYDSFGRVISNTGNIDFRYGYTGREADAETGLDYYRARYYDAAVGGFISEDPIGFQAGDTNLRRYVGNNATNFIDPSGNIAWAPVIAVIVISHIAGEAFFPDHVQSPMKPCDIVPTPPDQGLKRAGVEMIVSLGLEAAPNLLKTGVQGLRGFGKSAGSGEGLPYTNQVPSDRMLGQELPMSCGAACARQLLRDRGIDVAESNIRDLAKYTERYGTEPSTLRDALNELHPSGQFKGGGVSPDDLDVLKNGSFIARLKSPNGSHFVIVDGVKDGKVFIRDPWPLNGVTGNGSGTEGEMSLSKFMDYWNKGINQVVYPTR
jgi:RHS repeat-associated protein